LFKDNDTVVERLHKLSLLQSDTLISHANGMTVSEVSLLRNANAHISSTPATEIGMGLGDPVPATNPELCTYEHVSLGVDCHSYMATDAFTHLRLLMAAVRGSQNRPIVDVGNHSRSINFSAEDAFLIATMGGAKAVGMGSEIGSLEVGKRADVVIFDASNSPGMIMAAENDAVAAVVLHASVRDVETVIVDGKIRKSGGKLLPLDNSEGTMGGSWESISSKLRESAHAIFTRAEGVDWDVATEQLRQLFGIDETKLV
jgi:cytosine/adenosine deaminase-related metal-dependent hydrolase